MRALLDRRKQNDEGFTLIELLLVIIILGILAAVVVFSVRGVSDRGKTSACKSSKTAIATASEAYFAKTGTYPKILTALKPDFVSDFGGTVVDGDATAASPTSTITGGGTENGWSIAYQYIPGATATDPPSYTLTTTDC